MKMGADRKRVILLAVLGLAAVYLLYTNVISSPSVPSSSNRTSRVVAPNAPAAAAVAPPASTTRAPAGRRSVQEFRPSYKLKAGTDPTAIDPKLRLDLLAKVQSVDPAPAERNLFQFGAAAVPASAVHEPKPIKPKTQAEIAQELAQQAAAAAPPGPPPPPAITLKYYGYTAQRADGRKRAFFLDGEDIFVAAEGDLVKRRYKVVRIGVSSVVVEDTQFNSTQTLPLQEEAVG